MNQNPPPLLRIAGEKIDHVELVRHLIGRPTTDGNGKVIELPITQVVIKLANGEYLTADVDSSTIRNAKDPHMDFIVGDSNPEEVFTRWTRDPFQGGNATLYSLGHVVHAQKEEAMAKLREHRDEGEN